MNRVILTGRTTSDIEIKSAGEHTYTRFNLAVSRVKGNESDFIACQAWNKTAELLQKHVSKGDRIGIEGCIRTGSYEKDGRRVYTTDVVVEKVEFLSTKQKEEPKKDVPEGFSKLEEDYPF